MTDENPCVHDYEWCPGPESVDVTDSADADPEDLPCWACFDHAHGVERGEPNGE